jgi:hypothetical protein
MRSPQASLFFFGHESMTVSTQGLNVFWRIVFVIAVKMMSVHLTHIFWYKGASLTTGFEIFAVCSSFLFISTVV